MSAILQLFPSFHSYPLLGLRFSLTDGGLPRLLRLHTRLRRVQSRFHTRPLLSGSQTGRHRVVLGAVLQLNTNYSCRAKTKHCRKMNRTEEPWGKYGKMMGGWVWEAVTKVPTVSVCELTCTPLGPISLQAQSTSHHSKSVLALFSWIFCLTLYYKGLTMVSICILKLMSFL